MADYAWHVNASRDLEAIAEFIGRDSPISAAAFTTRLVAAADRLQDFPDLGRIVPEINHETYREIIFQNYRIVYRRLRQRVIVNRSRACGDGYRALDH